MGVLRDPIFDLGRVYVTRGAHAKFDTKDLYFCLVRHNGGDWGDVPPEDKAANNDALIEGDRLISAYELPEGRVWIVTEADRSVTTILLPDEY